MSFKPIDESKEDFRMYLAKHGVLDSLTKVLAKIQEHQPENPLEYLSANLSTSLVYENKVQELEEKLNQSVLENTRLKSEIDRMKKQRFFDGFSKTD